MIEHEHPEIVIEDPDENERRFLEDCKKWKTEIVQDRNIKAHQLEHLMKEQVVPPCVMYQRD